MKFRLKKTSYGKYCAEVKVRYNYSGEIVWEDWFTHYLTILKTQNGNWILIGYNELDEKMDEILGIEKKDEFFGCYKFKDTKSARKAIEKLIKSLPNQPLGAKFNQFYIL